MSETSPQTSTADLEYPPLPLDLERNNWVTLVKYFGPGAIMASITIGSGETVFASRGGAVFGFSILWIFLFSGLAKAVQVYSGARHITLTGQHPLAAWNNVTGLRGWFPLFVAVLSLLSCPFWLGGLPKMLGTLVNWMVGIPEGLAESPAREHYALMVKLWGTGFVAVAITMTLLQTYALLEKVQGIIVGLLLVSILAAAVAANPDLVAVFLSSVMPQIPVYPSWALEKYPGDFGKRHMVVELTLYAGAMGGGTQDYIGYIGILREKGWGLMQRFSGGNPAYGKGQIPLPLNPEQVSRGLKWLRAPFIDVGVSFLCIVLFTYAFIILGAQILHPQELAPSGSQLLTVQKQFLTQIHGSLTYLYQVGVFMAFFGTIYGAFEIYTRTAHESIIVVVPRLRAFSVRKLRPWMLGYCAIGSLALMWSEFDAVEIVIPAAILGSVLTCGLWCLAMVLADRQLLPQPYRMNRAFVLALVISGLALTGLGVAAAVLYFTG
jgi:hypothetical protein